MFGAAMLRLRIARLGAAPQHNISGEPARHRPANGSAARLDERLTMLGDVVICEPARTAIGEPDGSPLHSRRTGP
jgi:hypothetical protein